jgi:hypothetical protein
MDTIGRVYVVGRKVKYSMLLKLNGASKATWKLFDIVFQRAATSNIFIQYVLNAEVFRTYFGEL